MANKVEFEDYSLTVKAALSDKIDAFLRDAGIELTAKTQQNSRPVKYGSHDVKGSWNYSIDNTDKSVSVGSPLEAAFWEEFGTGEHALHKDGRKGWWVYVEGNESPTKSQKYYTEEEARQTAAFLQSQGLDAYATNGVEPNQPLQRAFTSMRTKIQSMAEKELKGLDEK